MDVLVTDEHGFKVIYQESLNDIIDLEEELLKIGTYYINQHEYVYDTDQQEPVNAIDRGELALHLME